ncbi:MAG: CoB--CoM heterodisulfide reductase iron-sulfur subunit A family protein [Candidatus Bathyarchaeia archaeon]
MSQTSRIGVYICHCGLNIAEVMNVDDIVKYTASLPNVIIAQDYRYVCSDPGQMLIKNDVEEYDLDRVVVASCSPRMHESTFRKVLEEAGLNPYMLEMVNIREQCSWVHIGEPEKATEKAKSLIKMAVVRSNLLEPLQIKEVSTLHNALVIGGGIAGLSAALDLANQNYEVFLVEKEPSIGGHMAQLDKTFPTMDCSICIFAPKMVDVGKHPNITLITYSEVKEVTGIVGNFHVKIHKKPRFVDAGKCVGCGICANRCPVKIPNEFDMGLGVRKSIYVPFPQSIPLVYTIDKENCLYFTKGVCRICEKFCETEAIDFNQEPETIELDVGAIIVATGFDTYDPVPLGEYGYGTYPNVITSLQMERLMNAAGPTGGKIRRQSDGEKPTKIAFIQCVGSRDKRTGNVYCSNACCLNSIKLARQIKEKYPDSEVFIFYNDIRAFGRRFEEFYSKAREDWVTFIKGIPSEIKEQPQTNNLIITAEDVLSGFLLEAEVELVVLAVGMIPSKTSEELSRILHIPRGTDGFFLEAHPKLRPVETNTAGIFLAGSCQGPKEIPESIAQGKAAASSVATLLSQGKIRIESMIASIDQDLCVGCGLCEESCPYVAITVIDRKATLEEALCKSCGTCASLCPEHAIAMKHFTDMQVKAQILAAFER